jgi:hypothetical protein
VKEIRAGDLVIVVKPTVCCSGTQRLGVIYRVVDVHIPPTGYLRCPVCNLVQECGRPAACNADGKYDYMERLKRIDPLANPEEAPAKVERAKKKHQPA